MDNSEENNTEETEDTKQTEDTEETEDTNINDNIERQIDNIIEASIENLESRNMENTEDNNTVLKSLVDDKNVEVFNIALHQYLTIEEEIKALLIAIKDRNKKKRQLGESLSTYLQANQVSTVKLGGSYKGKKLENTVSYNKTGFTKASVTEAIHNELKEDDEIFAKVMESISRKTILKEIWKIKIVNEKQGVSKLDKAKTKIDIAEELLNEEE